MSDVLAFWTTRFFDSKAQLPITVTSAATSKEKSKVAPLWSLKNVAGELLLPFEAYIDLASHGTKKASFKM